MYVKKRNFYKFLYIYTKNLASSLIYIGIKPVLLYYTQGITHDLCWHGKKRIETGVLPYLSS